MPEPTQSRHALAEVRRLRAAPSRSLRAADAPFAKAKAYLRTVAHASTVIGPLLLEELRSRLACGALSDLPQLFAFIRAARGGAEEAWDKVMPPEAHDAKPAIVRVSSTSAWNHPDLSLLRDGGGHGTSRGIRSSEAESETVQIVKKLKSQLQGCQRHLQELERKNVWQASDDVTEAIARTSELLPTIKAAIERRKSNWLIVRVQEELLEHDIRSIRPDTTAAQLEREERERAEKENEKRTLAVNGDRERDRSSREARRLGKGVIVGAEVGQVDLMASAAQLFRTIDTDNSGTLSIEEVRRALSGYGQSLVTQALEKMSQLARESAPRDRESRSHLKIQITPAQFEAGLVPVLRHFQIKQEQRKIAVQRKLQRQADKRSKALAVSLYHDTSTLSRTVHVTPDEYRDLSRTRLKGMDFHGRDMSNLNLSDADLRDCNFQGALLNGTKLPLWSSGLLAGVKLAGAVGWMPEDKNLRNAKLSRADLSGHDLSHVDFRNADLEGCDLNGVSLYGAALQGAKGGVEGVTLDVESPNDRRGCHSVACGAHCLCRGLWNDLKVGRPIIFQLTVASGMRLRSVDFCNVLGPTSTCDNDDLVRCLEIMTAPSATGPWDSVLMITAAKVPRKQFQTFHADEAAPILAGFIKIVVHSTYGGDSCVQRMVLTGQTWGSPVRCSMTPP